MLEQILSIGFITAFLSAALRLAVPLMYAGLGETISEKSGILNIGMEGVMLSGAFFSFAGAWFSKSLFVGILCGMLGGVLITSVHAVLTIMLAKDQSVTGLAINMVVLGLTSFLFKLMSTGQSYQQIETLPTFPIPLLSRFPVIGEVFFNRDILTYLLYVLLIVLFVFYRRTNLGLSFASIGENPRAAASAGVPVHRYQWIAMLMNGVLGGIGGAYLVLVQLGVFTENMTSGRGYIALATVILGRYTPFGMFGAALLFGAASAMQIRLQTIGVSISPFLLAILPYAITLFAMLTAIGKNTQPDSLGKPYIKGSR
jgi:simple sugar transport system permease protein